MQTQPIGDPRLRFSIVELAIVIFIIAILAAVAVPEFPDNRRHQSDLVARVRSEQRALAAAIEAYFAEHRAYPAMRPLAELSRYSDYLARAGGAELAAIEPGRGSALHGLTTPVPYLAALTVDVFTASIHHGRARSAQSVSPYAYYVPPDNAGWIVFSPGPDGDYDIADPAAVYDASRGRSPELVELAYDPTNGHSSNGDIFRVKQ